MAITSSSPVPSTSMPKWAAISASISAWRAERCYPDYRALIAGETARKDGIDVVSIATPNFTHYEITKACLEAGLHVICEKPLFFTVAECDEVARLAEQKGLIVGVTYGYTGHPLVHQMAAMVKKGMLGDIRIVDLQYTHGFNAGDDVGAGEAVKWRTNPRTAGPTFVLGDIGTHLYYLSEIVLPHMKVERLLCDRQGLHPDAGAAGGPCDGSHAL
ncbi:putative dehydrogenase [Agrobacterium sp. SORGH_AS440]|nr:putative dehydrogenase [Agrobacterium sp. SORGH_AS_0440]